MQLVLVETYYFCTVLEGVMLQVHKNVDNYTQNLRLGRYIVGYIFEIYGFMALLT